jgi:hypothetical protein
MDLGHTFFNWCVEVLVNIGKITGMGYELANIVIFVIIQPALILLFFSLWIYAKRKYGTNGFFKTHRTKTRSISRGKV